MKIAQIAPPWITVPPQSYGGTENVLYDLIEAQVAMGHDVTLFAPGDAKTSAKLVSFIPKALREEDVPWCAHAKAYYHLHRSVEEAARGDFDMIHTHLSATGDLYLFPLTAPLTVPHVATLHSHFPFDHVQPWVGDADALYLKQWAAAVPVVCISKHARALAPAELRVAGTVYNGLSMKDYTSNARRHSEKLVWIGRFVPEKGPHVAIEAAKRTGRPLVLAGTVDDAVPEAVTYFQEMIEPHIDRKQIRYIGPVNLEQKIRLLSSAAGFLNPIDWEEPFGMVMVEAMALGCPVISFTRGAASELIVDGKSGFLVDDLDEMVKAIPRLASLDRHAVRQHVERHFSANAMAEQYMRVYQEIRNTFGGGKKKNANVTAPSA